MKKYIIFCFVILTMRCDVLETNVKEICSFYDQPIAQLSSFKQKGIMHDCDSIVQFFTYFNTSSYRLIRKIRADIRIIEKHMKKHKDYALHILRDQLRDILNYIKKHKINNDAVIFHANLQEKYQPLFDMISEERDVIHFINNNRSRFNLEKEDNCYLEKFLKDLQQVASRISEFEDYVHSDYIDIKLMNYVFKIELIKLRNVILFDKRYKN